MGFPMSLMRPILVIAALTLTAGEACKHSEHIPTERLMVVKVAAAPSLSKPDPFAAALGTVRRGEAFRVRSKLPEVKWSGLFDGRLQERLGLLEASRRPLDRDSFVFVDDFMESDIPTSAWLCAHMKAPAADGAPCADTLLRTIATSNTLLAYVPCWQSECPIASLSGGVLTHATIPMLSEVRVVTLSGQPLVLAWSHWARSPQWTGGSVLAMQVSPPLRPAGEIPLFETDARNPDSATIWIGAIDFGEEALRLRGRRSVRNRQTGKELSGTDIDERWVMGQDGNLTRQ
jgi:hypothetical protein